MAQDITRGQVWDIIVKQAEANPKYRSLLLSDPRSLLAKQLNTEIPASVKVEVLEETPDKYYIVLPYAPKTGAELADSDLEKVAGGVAIALKANCAGGMLNTVNEIRLG